MTTTVSANALLALRVVRLEPAAAGVRAITFTRDDGGALPRWQPGNHLELRLPGRLVRHYSLCSDPTSRDVWRIAALDEPDGRGGSAFLCRELRDGDVLESSPPRDNFRYRDGTHPQLFVAGGIGITPLVPMIAAAEASGAPWRLLYLGRSRASMAFTADLDRFGDRVMVHPKDAAGSLDLGTRLDALDAELRSTAPAGEAAQLYACGPTRLIDAVVGWASASPDRATRVHVERFTGVDASPRLDDAPFTVELPDGTEIAVAADESILEAVGRSGIPALNSCREGVCGTCETPVIDGMPDHRDHLLSDEERASNETMMICVSRCIGARLVLDL
ncbi:PDR/VanB family oxidoreductase [Agromyces humatus]|uniref:PDR/VanB family oxidoreductase n=1 Tax=Agromyces humatus TaxID=279573 RepID=A0ABP4X9F5_9MICO|nr:PDR/VanB family oxidoreductase [Agromyces humatus]